MSFFKLLTSGSSQVCSLGSFLFKGTTDLRETAQDCRAINLSTKEKTYSVFTTISSCLSRSAEWAYQNLPSLTVKLPKQESIAPVVFMIELNRIYCRYIEPIRKSSSNNEWTYLEENVCQKADYEEVGELVISAVAATIAATSNMLSKHKSIAKQKHVTILLNFLSFTGTCIEHRKVIQKLFAISSFLKQEASDKIQKEYKKFGATKYHM